MIKTRQMLVYVLPVMIESALGTLIGITGTVMVAHVGPEAVSGVSMVDSVNFLLMNFFMAVATGTTVVISQLAGQGDYNRILSVTRQSLSLSVMTAVVTGFFLYLFNDTVVLFLFGRADAGVLANGRVYLAASALSYPFLAFFSTSAGILRGSGDSRTSMYASIIINLVNVAVCAVGIYVLGMGVYGAAAGLLLSRIAGAAIMVLILAKKNGRELFLDFHKLSMDVLKPVLWIGVPAGLDSLIFNGGKLLVQTFMSGMGTVALTANSISSSVFNFAVIPGNAFAIAIVTFAGQAWGCGRKRDARRVIVKTTLLSSLSLFLTSSVVLLLTPQILRMFRPTEETFQLAQTLCHMILLCMPLIWSASFALPAGLRAVNDVGVPTAASVVSMWVIRVGSGWFLGVYLGWGVAGIWAAMLLDWLGRALFFSFRLTGRRWKEASPPEEKSVCCTGA